MSIIFVHFLFAILISSNQAAWGNKFLYRLNLKHLLLEPRTLHCNDGSCFVTGKSGEPINTDQKCQSEKITGAILRLSIENETSPAIDDRISCPANAEKALKSSASYKQPQTARNCVRYYTYGDYKSDDWKIWVRPPCFTVNVTIWYFFPD